MSEQQQEYGGIIINGIDCSGGGGSSVTPNPPAPATETLSSLDINGVVYGIEQETRENIFSIFDTFNLNDDCSSGQLVAGDHFTFGINDARNDWSGSTTIYNNNAYDLTDIDKLELVVEVTQQSDYAYLWLTFSNTKYTWGGSSWVSTYQNVDSAIQVSQSGSYEIDVSELTGSYYIYIGATSGKDSVTKGDCNNSHNGVISGTVTEFNIISTRSGTNVIPNPSGTATDTLEKLQIENTIYDFDAGTEVIANPTGTATDTLNIISIDGTIYEIEGGGSGGEGTTTDVLFSKTPDNIHEPTITLSNSLFDYDMIAIDYVYVGNNIPYHIGHSYMTDGLNIGDNIGFESGGGNTWYSITNNTTLTLAQSQTAWCIVSIIGFKYGNGGSDVEANPIDPATDTLTKIGIDGTVYELTGGSDGSSGVYIEETLYTAPSNSFVDITVDWGWKDYDIYIFRVHDTYSENGDTTILTKGQISSMVSSGNHQYFFRFGSSNCSYVFTSSQLTARANANGLFIEQIVGIKVSGDYYSPVIYSTEEREIGVWTDNKPLYQKTIKVSSITSEALTYQNHNISNIETIADIKGFLHVKLSADANNTFTPLPRIQDTNASLNIGVDVDKTKIVVKARNLISGANVFDYAVVTIQYTKTTDTAGSGSYNTLGVPTVHYTTDEQVIGTWVDGKPLYQKTLHLTSLSGTSYQHVLSNDISFVNKAEANVKLGNEGGNQWITSPYVESSSYRCDCHWQSSDNSIYIKSSWGMSEAYITIQYTKTTD